MVKTHFTISPWLHVYYHWSECEQAPPVELNGDFVWRPCISYVVGECMQKKLGPIIQSELL